MDKRHCCSIHATLLPPGTHTLSPRTALTYARLQASCLHMQLS